VNFETVNLIRTIGRCYFINLLGVIILLIGVGISGFIYLRASQTGGSRIEASSDADDSDLPFSPEDSRKYGRALEMNVGKLGVLMDDWSRTWSKLGDPKPLAITIALLSILAAGACFTLAARVGKNER